MMEFTTMSVPNPPAASAAALAAANSVYAVVTPTGDEFELLHSQHQNDNSVFLESAAVAVSAAPPAAAAAGNTTFPCCEYNPTSFSSSSTTFTPSYGASYGHHPSSAFQSASLVPGYHHPTADHHDYEGSEKMEAAQALCCMKNLGAGCPPQQCGTVVDVAMKMMSSEKNEHFHNDQEGALLRSIDVAEESTSSDNHVLSNSLVHPDRLASDDDVDEVNKLHQYVRKELLEIFVVPQTSDSDSEDDEDDDEDYRATKKSRCCSSRIICFCHGEYVCVCHRRCFFHPKALPRPSGFPLCPLCRLSTQICIQGSILPPPSHKHLPRGMCLAENPLQDLSHGP